MATTSPDNIWTPDSGDDYALTVDLAATADSVQSALNNVRQFTAYKVGTNAQRLALTGTSLFEGLKFRTTDTKAEWLYTGGAWTALDSGWVALPLSNGWVNFGGGIYSDAQYRKLNGVVFVKGLVKSGTTSAGITLGTLPAGFRPLKQQMKPVTVAPGTGGSVDVAADGRIINNVVSATYTSLEFDFVAEQ